MLPLAVQLWYHGVPSVLQQKPAESATQNHCLHRHTLETVQLLGESGPKSVAHQESLSPDLLQLSAND